LLPAWIFCGESPSKKKPLIISQLLSVANSVTTLILPKRSINEWKRSATWTSTSKEFISIAGQECMDHQLSTRPFF